jgi:5-hydroxyisourate hydrolase-like protein (transthyretin family)
LFGGALAQAATVSGTVTDKTTGKPAAGDAVTLVEPMSGMSEVGHATTDANGHYKLNLPGSSPYLIRVTHQGADYFVAVPQGGGAADASVYDVAAKVAGVSVDEHVIGMETENGQLRVVERYTVRNTGAPPRTQWSQRSFEVILPADATPGEASAQRPGTSSLPTTVKLDPDGPKGHYSFNFPIQPDEGGKGTLFQIQYQLPYSSGSYTFHSSVALAANTTWVVLPKSLTFTGSSGSGFELSPQDPSVQTYLSRNGQPGKSLDFTISGTGSFMRDEQGAQSAAQQPADGSAAVPGNQPGGGIGAPINTPDPLSKYKWRILGGLALILIAAAAFMLRAPAAGAADTPAVATAPAAPAVRNHSLLDALKEELFALESEKIAGKLSAAEYAATKAALEVVLKRALQRQAN